MSLKKAKEQLNKVLGDGDNKVIALSGKWGTGKSHLWRELQHTSEDRAVSQALYVSLFGLSDMSQIQLKIVQSALPKAEEQPAMWKQARIAYAGTKKVLTSFYKGFSALDELALLAVPTMLKGKMVVLDDIERKHEKLSIDEILGFIDEYTNQYGARFVLILNSDQLANRIMWDTLREKVIDAEIRLDTTSMEAFEIASLLKPSIYALHIRKAVEIIGITNIRIICKVIKVVNSILGNRTDLSETILNRVIPSVVILTAINYKGVEDGPDFSFVLSPRGSNLWGKFLEEEEEPDEDRKREGRWELMLNDLGIFACDEYELLVVEFLQSGLFDAGAVSTLIDRFVMEANDIEGRHQLTKFTEQLFWGHKLTEDELLAKARTLVSKAYLLDAYDITAFCDNLTELSEGVNVSEEMIDEWIEKFKSKDLSDFELDDPFNRPIHPRIQVLFSANQTNVVAKTTVFDACEYIVKHSSWGSRQELAMKSASVVDFEQIIKILNMEDFRVFMSQMLKLCSQESTYESHFGSAGANFTEACLNIAEDQHSGRLGKLIHGLFNNARLGHKLIPLPKGNK
jgi:hypothetical protein